MIINRATNVWIKFIPFITEMWIKRILEVFRKYMESVTTYNKRSP